MVLCNGRRSAHPRPIHTYVYWEELGAYRDLCLPARARPVIDAEIFVERDVCLGWYEVGLSLRQAPASPELSVYSEPNIRQGPTKMNLI